MKSILEYLVKDHIKSKKEDEDPEKITFDDLRFSTMSKPFIFNGIKIGVDDYDLVWMKTLYLKQVEPLYNKFIEILKYIKNSKYKFDTALCYFTKKSDSVINFLKDGNYVCGLRYNPWKNTLRYECHDDFHMKYEDFVKLLCE